MRRLGALRDEDEAAMDDDLKQTTDEWSRRSVLRRGLARLTGVMIALAVGSRVALAAKFAQKAVFYRPKPSLGQKCSNCKIFVRPHSCRSVAGDISPNGWCVIWRE